jgi:hypothetical protein
MLNTFWNYINNILKMYNKRYPRFIHWSQAEPAIYNKILLKYPSLPKKDFLDLYKIFIEESIYINGALNYSLKTIAKTMYKHNLIKSTWNENSNCLNGLDAVMISINIYNKNKNVTDEIKEINEIKEYNEIDCKVLYEIINYLRLNH